MIDNNGYILTIEDLKICFDAGEDNGFAVNGVSLQLPRGRTLGVVGESGCGKTLTALAILKLIDRPGKIAGGKIVFYPSGGDPIEMTQLSEKSDMLYRIRGGYISMIFQEPMTSLSPVYSIGRQICEAIRLHADPKISKKKAAETAVDMLTKVGIPNAYTKINCYPHELSGGMRQRAAIAMAMVTTPQLLIADEPTTALDVTIQAQIIALMKQLQREYRTSIMLITHDFGVVAQTADDVAVMYLGNIIEQAPAREIIKNPLHPYTMALLRSLPALENRRKRLLPVKGFVPELPARPRGCPFYPRCQCASEGLCDNEDAPKLMEFAPGHKVACFKTPEKAKNGY
jgi:peptide/nickel transport system ATP-binding protein